ncbi:hypothetical protein [Bifidobacterium saguini]|uniref:hypothetical protein n=1 Tax=Bifidobacterium saguini TaxID=762210 RepID=UPI00053AE4B6|nr:hypothetical protein [Bifidobacterium saguini]
MSYRSFYNGIIRINHPTMSAEQLEQTAIDTLRTITGGWMDPDHGITRVSIDPLETKATHRWKNPCKTVIQIEPDYEETWYDWREDIDQLREKLKLQGINSEGAVYRHSDESGEPDYERLTITTDTCTTEIAWPTFPDGEEW